MRVLWSSGNPSMFANRDSHNGGGWISTLQSKIMESKNCNITLAIMFPWNENIKKEDCGITYYGVRNIRKSFFHYTIKEEKYLHQLLAIVKDFHPDVIHAFGTESAFGKICAVTDVPVVIHLQGILCAYYEAWLPEGLSWFQYFRFSPKMAIIRRNSLKSIDREREIFANCRFFMGRTDWDKSLAGLLAPDAKYYYCSEMLRPVIYNSRKTWHNKNNDIKKIVSIISSPVYKGGDVILRAAKVLKHYAKFNFVWEVYGISNLKFMSKLTGIATKDVNVETRGIINAEQLIDVICDSDVFVHPSYIENSPNTVCEAQLLGIPVIATNVGGVSSLIKNMDDGLLVPSNDIYMMASKIQKLITEPDLCEKLSTNGRQTALKRHNPDTIASEVLSIYNNMLK